MKTTITAVPDMRSLALGLAWAWRPLASCAWNLKSICDKVFDPIIDEDMHYGGNNLLRHFGPLSPPKPGESYSVGGFDISPEEFWWEDPSEGMGGLISATVRIVRVDTVDDGEPSHSFEVHYEDDRDWLTPEVWHEVAAEICKAADATDRRDEVDLSGVDLSGWTDRPDWLSEYGVPIPPYIKAYEAAKTVQRGRKPKPEKERRTKPVIIRFSEAERETLDQAVQVGNFTTVNGFIRQAALNLAGDILKK